MPELALISDIHGNGVALDAVLSDIATRNVAQIVCLGDIAAGGPQPRQVIRRLCGLGCHAVHGNADGWLLDGLPAGRSDATARLQETVAWAGAQLTDDDRAFLAALPPTLRCRVGCVDLFCFHGSPRSDLEPLLATTSDQTLDEALTAADARVFAAGHTHVPLLRRHRDRMLVNPGSVGLPLGAMTCAEPLLPAFAEYAIVTVSDGSMGVTFRRLRTDVDALRAASTALPHPTWATDLEQRITRWNTNASA